MNRRSFIKLASGLLAAVHEPVRAYSFVGGWAEPEPLGLDTFHGLRILQPNHELPTRIAHLPDGTLFWHLGETALYYLNKSRGGWFRYINRKEEKWRN